MNRWLWLLFILFLSCGYDADKPPSYENEDPTVMAEDLPLSCESSGGTWKTFPSACTDRCEIRRPDVCATVLTEDCNCGDGRCFLEGECINNPPWHHRR